MRAFGALALLAALHGRPLAAQDVRLAGRLDKATLTAVNALIDSARVERLPTAPLVDKALEGAARGSDGGRIVNAVHQLSMRMATARGVLGASASADEIKLGAAALDVGVSERDLALLRTACGKRPATMSLAVLSDLIGRSVPVATATTSHHGFRLSMYCAMPAMADDVPRKWARRHIRFSCWVRYQG